MYYYLTWEQFKDYRVRHVAKPVADEIKAIFSHFEITDLSIK